MKQYTQHLRDIITYGTHKPAARENMPGTKSLFGYQWKHDLANGFPLLTTKKVYWKGIIVELLWFLRGDTNVKWLDDNGVTFWNQDAYAHYLKKCKKYKIAKPISFIDFESILKNNKTSSMNEECKNVISHEFSHSTIPNYTLGDCGFQYGKVWRDWNGDKELRAKLKEKGQYKGDDSIDQIKKLLHQLKNNPEGRRHILTSIDPAHDNDLALYWCHALTQFNCRPIPWEVKLELAKRNTNVEMENLAITEAASGNKDYGNVPQYYLDCQMYQRSADMFLGVPLNVASYALLTHIFCKLLNMIPGEMTYSYGDSHIYDNHMDAVKEQLTREEKPLPKLNINTEFWLNEIGECGIGTSSIDGFLDGLTDASFVKSLIEEDIQLIEYNPHPAIKAELSTGIKKQ